MRGRAAVTRERYIDLVMSFLAWCQKRPRRWLAELPAIERDREARYKKQRRARRVGDLRPELIAALIGYAAPHLRADHLSRHKKRPAGNSFSTSLGRRRDAGLLSLARQSL